MDNVIEQFFRLKRPCSNCPFRKEGAIELEVGRLEEIIKDLLSDDKKAFLCHKVVHSCSGGEWDEDGTYHPSQKDAGCAGAHGYLFKVGRPTVGMRLAFVTGDSTPLDWEAIADEIIDIHPSSEIYKFRR